MGREWGIPVLIDGAQSAGAIPVDVTALGIDFYAIPMQKWLCGPDGTGALYVRREALHYVAPTYVGYTWIFERIASLSTYAYNALKAVPGLTLLTPRPGESGLVAFKLEDRDVSEVVMYLSDKHNIYIRSIPTTNSLRISTGFYNTEEEIDQLVEALLEV